MAPKSPKEDEGSKKEATVSLAAAIKASVDAAVGADLSELDDIFTLKDQEQWWHQFSF